jgi:hypothetical protein
MSVGWGYLRLIKHEAWSSALPLEFDRSKSQMCCDRFWPSHVSNMFVGRDRKAGWKHRGGLQALLGAFQASVVADGLVIRQSVPSPEQTLD